MNNRNIQSRSQAVINRVRLIGIIVVCLVLASTAPAVVRAAIAAINTNDGAWDSNWGTPMRIDGDDAGIEDDVDIDTFWVNTNAASPTMYYFGVSTVTALRAGGGTRICVKVDCNNNGFPDDWTDTGMPEGRRAFMMGNALVVGAAGAPGHEVRRPPPKRQ